MNDPRLNSIHLDLPRRQEFRAARDLLLNGRGDQTICAEAHAAAGPPADLPIGTPPGVVDAVAARFVLMDKDYVYPLKIGLNTIGRMPDNDVVVDDNYVSRRHCAILVHADGRCELQDVASKNGTLVNGQKIPGPTVLKSGDEIRMCTHNLVFVSRDAAPASPPSHQTMAE